MVYCRSTDMLEEHAAEGGNGRTRVCVGAPGFAIVVTIAMLALLAVVTLGFLSLSTIQVRQSTSGTSGALRQIGMMERAH